MDIEKKYELIPSDREGLFRIKALKDFGNVKKGDIGGYVESEGNLSHDGNCWIYSDAIVRDYSVVMDNARIYGDALIQDNAIVWGDAVVCNNARVEDNAKVWGDVRISDKAQVRGFAQVWGDAAVYDNAVVCGHTEVRDRTSVHDKAIVRDNVVVIGNAEVCGDAIITSNKDYIVFKNWWSSGRYFTWTRSNNMWKVGCFFGTGEQLIAKAYKDSEEKGREYERIVKYVEIVNNF